MPRLSASALINLVEDDEVIIADGAMGTELIRRGAKAEETLNCNRRHPDWVRDVHLEYIEAGAQLLYSNTFAPPKSPEEYADVLAGWQILRDVCKETKREVWAALSLYPGTVCDHPELMDQIFTLPNAADLVVIETCVTMSEAKKAIREVRKRSAAYLFATASFGNKGRMNDGTTPAQWRAFCHANGDLIGFGANCDVESMGLPESIEREWNTGKPLLFRPSYLFDPSGEKYEGYLTEMWAMDTFLLALHRVSIVGGCCGTTPKHILYMRHNVETLMHI